MEYGNLYITGLIGTIYNNDGSIKEKGVELIDIVKQVQGQPIADAFNVYINSPGGVVETGFEIYNYLRSLKKPLTTIGVSKVASIGTVIFSAGDRRYLKAGTEFLIHLPMIGIDGYLNSQDLENASKEIAEVDKQIIDHYKKITGLTDEVLIPLLKKETILDIETAFDLKFTTEQEYVVPAVAYLNNNLKKEKMSKEKSSWLDEQFKKIVAVVNGGELPKKGFVCVALKKETSIVNIDVTDANGIVITFPDVEMETTPTVGDVAVIDGTQATGEYLMPNGEMWVFSDGKLSQIIEVVEAENNSEITDLENQIADLQAKLESQKTAFNVEVVALKKNITSHYVAIEKGEKIEGVVAEPKKRKIFKD